MTTPETDLRSVTTDLEAWRRYVRSWLEENAPRRRAAGQQQEAEERLEMGSERERQAVDWSKAFQALLYDAGLAGITVPKEYGGQGLTQDHQRIYSQEAAGYELPTGPFTIGFGMCLPTILAHGTEEQKRRHVPAMLRGEEIWSQLFSEPGAGSDVASLQMRAVRHDDEWIVNGQKVWTSGAHYSDFGCCIMRTDVDVPKHRGLTMFIVDMRAPGVTVKPLRQITGEANFNEVFFDDVRVPHENVLGEVNDGWRVAMTMLMNERVALGGGGGGGGRGGGIDGLIRLARERGAATSAVARRQIVDLYIQQSCLTYLRRRMTQQAQAGKTPGPEGSLLKLGGTRASQRMSELAVELAGPGGVAWDPNTERGGRWSQGLLGSRSGSIAGGTDEVLRNIIGERVLGLPKEPQVDRDVPFRELKVGTVR